MEALIEAGADTTMLYAHDLSLLHLAIQADQPAVVEFLIKDRNTLKFRTSDLWTPLYSTFARTMNQSGSEMSDS